MISRAISITENLDSSLILYLSYEVDSLPFYPFLGLTKTFLVLQFPVKSVSSFYSYTSQLPGLKGFFITFGSISGTFSFLKSYLSFVDFIITISDLNVKLKVFSDFLRILNSIDR